MSLLTRILTTHPDTQIYRGESRNMKFMRGFCHKFCGCVRFMATHLHTDHLLLPVLEVSSDFNIVFVREFYFPPAIQDKTVATSCSMNKITSKTPTLIILPLINVVF